MEEMKEKESAFQSRVVEMATRYGWKVWHVPAPMVWDARSKAFRPARGGAGLPDLILIHNDPPRLVFMELKREGGKLSERQQEFLQAAKTVAESWPDGGVIQSGEFGVFKESFEKAVGVMAVWPKDEQAVEQMLRTKVVA